MKYTRYEGEGRNGDRLYREVQHNRQVLPWLIIGFISLLMFLGFFWQVVLGNSLGTNQAPDAVMIVFFVVFGIGLPVSFFIMNLTIEVWRDGLYFRFFPFNREFQRISIEDLSSARVRIYRPLEEYGGWGIRFSRNSMAYSISGNGGVELAPAGRRPLLLGSRNPEGLEQAIHRLARSS